MIYIETDIYFKAKTPLHKEIRLAGKEKEVITALKYTDLLERVRWMNESIFITKAQAKSIFALHADI